MEIVTFLPETVQSWSLPLQEVRLLPIGDIQYGAAGCDIERLKRHLDWGMEHDCHFVGMGDYVDVASPSNRKKIISSRPELYDSTRQMMDEAAEFHLEKVTKLLEPTKGRWFGLLSGHHYWQFENGDTTDTRLARSLGTRFLGTGAAKILLQFKQPHSTGRGSYNGVAKIWVHHGRGGGSTVGAALNKIAHIAQREFAHVYLIGHYHTKASTKIPFKDHHVTSKGNIIETSVDRILASTGGFLKGYEVGARDPFGHATAGYVEQAMLSPTTLGGTLVFIRPKMLHGRVVIDTNISL